MQPQQQQQQQNLIMQRAKQNETTREMNCRDEATIEAKKEKGYRSACWLARWLAGSTVVAIARP